jgi:hypothetical protein
MGGLAYDSYCYFHFIQKIEKGCICLHFDQGVIDLPVDPNKIGSSAEQIQIVRNENYNEYEKLFEIILFFSNSHSQFQSQS